MLVMFSMAGIPPLVGFYAKFKILAALISIGYIGVAIFAVIMSLIGAFYYIRVVKFMYFDEPTKEVVAADACVVTRTLLAVNVLALLVIGVLPTSLLVYCQHLVN